MAREIEKTNAKLVWLYDDWVEYYDGEYVDEYEAIHVATTPEAVPSYRRDRVRAFLALDDVTKEALKFAFDHGSEELAVRVRPYLNEIDKHQRLMGIAESGSVEDTTTKR